MSEYGKSIRDIDNHDSRVCDGVTDYAVYIYFMLIYTHVLCLYIYVL